MTDDKEREVKCPACDGKGYAEIIEGWQRPCDACYGECFLRQPTQTDTLKIAREALEADPLVEALTKAGWGMPEINAKAITAALDARGLEIREKGQ